ncbi:MAG TPA: hypothetical protein VD866_23495 [Urbifossiella sp.]|nr:hypothetical protein [Urbifossiella sp.]
MAKQHFKLRLCPVVVARLRRLALRAGFERGVQTSWVDLLHEGADLVLKNHGEAGRTPAEPKTQLVTS